MPAKPNRLYLLIIVVATPALIFVTLLALAANRIQGGSRIASAATLQRAASADLGRPEGSKQSALAATLIGHAKWEGWPPGQTQPDPLQARPFTITLRSGGTATNYPFMYTDEYGFFTITTDLPNGTYQYRFKGHPPDPVHNRGPSWLVSVGSVVITNSLTTRLELGYQRGGDADNSNLDSCTSVDVVDFNILKNTFALSSSDAQYDNRANFVQELITGTPIVDVYDFNVLKTNMGWLPPFCIGPSPRAAEGTRTTPGFGSMPPRNRLK